MGIFGKSDDQKKLEGSQREVTQRMNEASLQYQNMRRPARQAALNAGKNTAEAYGNMDRLLTEMTGGRYQAPNYDTLFADPYHGTGFDEVSMNPLTNPETGEKIFAPSVEETIKWQPREDRYLGQQYQGQTAPPGMSQSQFVTWHINSQPQGYPRNTMAAWQLYQQQQAAARSQAPGQSEFY